MSRNFPGVSDQPLELHSKCLDASARGLAGLNCWLCSIPLWRHAADAAFPLRQSVETVTNRPLPKVANAAKWQVRHAPSPLRGSRRRTLATLRVRLMSNSRERETA